jgi:hypothetical protein
MHLIKMTFIGFSLLLISFSTAGYEPAGTYANYPHGGYSDVRIDADTAIITYEGESEPRLSQYALYRAGQVSLNDGYHYFVILDQSYCQPHKKVLTIKMFQYRPMIRGRVYSVTEVMTHYSPNETW